MSVMSVRTPQVLTLNTYMDSLCVVLCKILSLFLLQMVVVQDQQMPDPACHVLPPSPVKCQPLLLPLGPVLGQIILPSTFPAPLCPPHLIPEAMDLFGLLEGPTLPQATL